jgi:cytochrome P450
MWIALYWYIDMRHTQKTFTEFPSNRFYVGPQPRIAITDVDLLKEIMVKEFDSFSDRGFLGPPQFAPKALGLHTGLVSTTGETWRTARQTLTPSFTGMKMKLMVPLIKKSSDVLVEKMGEFAESGKTVELFREYGYFTTESLIATAFGRYVNLQRGEADQITEDARGVIQSSEDEATLSPDTLLICLANFPWLEPLLLLAIRKSKVGHALTSLHKTARRLIRDRVQSQQPPKVKDLLQLMIDSAIEDGKDPQNDQIAGFSVEFLLAGYDTTSTALSYTSYLLAMNTDVQERLQTEIDEFFEEHPEASLYEAAQKLKYLDMVIQESLRYYSPVPKTQRYCSKTVTVGNVTIPEGAEIIIPINLIHRSPTYWPDPYKFDPERFTDEAKASRPQLAHMPFGWGPRNCIGLRFALLESKIALMEILRKFSFVRAPETAANLELLYGTTTTSKGGVWLKIVARE